MNQKKLVSLFLSFFCFLFLTGFLGLFKSSSDNDPNVPLTIKKINIGGDEYGLNPLLEKGQWDAQKPFLYAKKNENNLVVDKDRGYSITASFNDNYNYLNAFLISINYEEQIKFAIAKGKGILAPVIDLVYKNGNFLLEVNVDATKRIHTEFKKALNLKDLSDTMKYAELEKEYMKNKIIADINAQISETESLLKTQSQNALVSTIGMVELFSKIFDRPDQEKKADELLKKMFSNILFRDVDYVVMVNNNNPCIKSYHNLEVRKAFKKWLQSPQNKSIKGINEIESYDNYPSPYWWYYPLLVVAFNYDYCHASIGMDIYLKEKISNIVQTGFLNRLDPDLRIVNSDLKLFSIDKFIHKDFDSSKNYSSFPIFLDSSLFSKTNTDKMIEQKCFGIKDLGIVAIRVEEGVSHDKRKLKECIEKILIEQYPVVIPNEIIISNVWNRYKMAIDYLITAREQLKITTGVKSKTLDEYKAYDFTSEEQKDEGKLGDSQQPTTDTKPTTSDDTKKKSTKKKKKVSN